MAIKIIPFKTAYLSEVALLHLANLSTPFRGIAGQKLLISYYKTLVKGEGGTGFVALDNDKVAGYVCGVWDVRALRRQLIREHGFSLCFWGVIQVIRAPNLLRSFLSRFLDAPNEAKISGYELRPIVVRPEYRGMGISTQLVQKLLKDAKNRGYRSVHLYAEWDNDAAIRFYSKAGFHQCGKVMQQQKEFIQFSINVQGEI